MFTHVITFFISYYFGFSCDFFLISGDVTLKSADGVVRSDLLSIESGKTLVGSGSLFKRTGDIVSGESGSVSIRVLKYWLLAWLTNCLLTACLNACFLTYYLIICSFEQSIFTCMVSRIFACSLCFLLYWLGDLLFIFILVSLYVLCLYWLF